MDQRVSRKPTISDVARQAGISTATVSRTLATPEKVTAQTRAIVMEAVRKIGYVPNLAARNLRTNRTRTILAVLPDFSNVFFSRVLRGISDTLVAQGLQPDHRRHAQQSRRAKRNMRSSSWPAASTACCC